MVAHLTTSWSQCYTLAEGFCKSIDKKSSVGAECNRNDVNVPHEIPDMWQFCRTIGKGNHNNTPYNVLCCGTPPNFPRHLHKLSVFRLNNPYSAINFTFVVPLDPTAAWWHKLPRNQVITLTPIVLTYGDQSTIPAALFTTIQQPSMDPTPDDSPTSIIPPKPTLISLNTVLTPPALEMTTSTRS
jgi:hypothetical protein